MAFRLIFFIIFLSSSFNNLNLLAKANTKIKPKCVFKVLKKLGWDITETNNKTTISMKHSCDNSSLQAAKREGKLKFLLNNNDSKKDFSYLLHSQMSKCAYMHKIKNAAQTATQKLQDNKNYTMGDLSYCDSQKNDNSRTYFSKENASDLVGCFYKGTSSSECVVGQDIASWATQYELYGAKDFNKAFSPNEVSLSQLFLAESVPSEFIALFKKVVTNPINIRNKKTMVDQNGAIRSKLGAMSFAGARGVIANSLKVNDSELFDSPSDRNENFIITNVSKSAAKKIKEIGGLGMYKQKFKEIFILLKSSNKNQNFSRAFKILRNDLFFQGSKFLFTLLVK